MKRKVVINKKQELAIPKHFLGALLSTGLGIGSSLIANKKQKKEQKRQQLQAYNQYIDERMLSDKIESEQDPDKDREMASYYFKKGGVIPPLGSAMPFDTMGGELNPISSNIQKADGNKHSEDTIDNTNGIKLIPKGTNTPIAEIEDDEVLAGNDAVFSDKLKYRKGKTYADEATKLGKKIEKEESKLEGMPRKRTVNGSTRNLSSLEGKLQALFLDQETKKVNKGTKDTEPVNKLEGGGSAWGGRDFVDYFLNDVGTKDKGVNWNKIKDGAKSAIPYLDNVVNGILIANTPKVPTPLYNKPREMETTVNVQPQLGQVSDSVNSASKSIVENTSNSNVARSNIVSAKLAGMKNVNSILANKENAERGLRNQNANQLAATESQNNAIKSKHLSDVANRSLGIQGRISKNVSQGIDDYIRVQENKDKKEYQDKVLDLEMSKYESSGVVLRNYLENPTVIERWKEDPNLRKRAAKSFLKTNPDGTFMHPLEAKKFLEMFPEEAVNSPINTTVPNTVSPINTTVPNTVSPINTTVPNTVTPSYVDPFSALAPVTNPYINHRNLLA